MQPSKVTDVLFQQLNFRGERQKVLSSNIANLDTPDYKTKELKFEDHMNKLGSSLPLYKTHPAHMSLSNDMLKSSMSVYEVQGLEEQNDGNNVNLDTQMSEISKNATMFQALQNSIKKDSAWFKNVIDASSKN